MTHPIPVALILLIFYLYLVLTYVTLKGCSIRRGPDCAWEPDVSVIVVARNEEETIPRCLESLKNLDYPKDKLEFILVDDRSEDDTGRWMKRFQKFNPNARYIRLDGKPSDRNGKIRGLVEAARAAAGEVLFFTDGDCEAPKTWIRSILKTYAPDVGLVAGFVLLDRKNGRFPLFARLQSLDWIHLTAIGSAWANLGYPLSVFGNNFSIRKNAYDQSGGFEAVGHHWTEDFALLRNVRDKTRWRMVWVQEETGAVVTQSAVGLREFFHQRKRWALGGRDRGSIAISLMTAAFLARFLVVLCLFLIQVKLALLGFWILFLSDGLLLIRSLDALNRMDLLKYMILYEFYCIGYSVFFAPFVVFGKNVRWK
jgi:cellulose synthase/poly-beta-1,6-N-acetylglucosamine synthase-like glycosyltransferase